MMRFGLISNPVVTGMIGKVTQNAVNSYISGLSGESPVLVEGTSYTITTRHTNSGTPVQKATQYVFEQLQKGGLRTYFHNWTLGTYANRNVVGELPGKTRPGEIVLSPLTWTICPPLAGPPAPMTTPAAARRC